MRLTRFHRWLVTPPPLWAAMTLILGSILAPVWVSLLRLALGW